MASQQRGIVRVGGQLLIQLLDFGHGLQHMGKGLLGLGVNGMAAVKVAQLLQIAQRLPAGEGQLGRGAVAVVIPQKLAGQQTQQGGFACAVDTDHTDAVVILHRGADIPQDAVGAEIFINVIDGQYHG